MEKKPNVGSCIECGMIDFTGRLTGSFWEQRNALHEEILPPILKNIWNGSYQPNLSSENLRYLLAELLSNATDAVKEVTDPHIKVRLYFDIDNSKYHIRIEDNGPGFPDDKLNIDLSKENLGTTKRNKEQLGGQGSGLHLIYLILSTVKGNLTYGNKEEGGAFVDLEISGSKNYRIKNLF